MASDTWAQQKGPKASIHEASPKPSKPLQTWSKQRSFHSPTWKSSSWGTSSPNHKPSSSSSSSHWDTSSWQDSNWQSSQYTWQESNQLNCAATLAGSRHRSQEQGSNSSSPNSAQQYQSPSNDTPASQSTHHKTSSQHHPQQGSQLSRDSQPYLNKQLSHNHRHHSSYNFTSNPWQHFQPLGGRNAIPLESEILSNCSAHSSKGSTSVSNWYSFSWETSPLSYEPSSSQTSSPDWGTSSWRDSTWQTNWPTRQGSSRSSCSAISVPQESLLEPSPDRSAHSQSQASAPQESLIGPSPDRSAHSRSQARDTNSLLSKSVSLPIDNRLRRNSKELSEDKFQRPFHKAQRDDYQNFHSSTSHVSRYSQYSLPQQPDSRRVAKESDILRHLRNIEALSFSYQQQITSVLSTFTERCEQRVHEKTLVSVVLRRAYTIACRAVLWPLSA